MAKKIVTIIGLLVVLGAVFWAIRHVMNSRPASASGATGLLPISQS